MAYLKNEFEKWIKSIKRNNGEPYSNETINNYISVIKNYSKKLDNLSIDSPDLFYVDNLTDFDKIHKEILSHPSFESVNKAYHRAFSSGLLIYKRFIETRHFSNDIVLSFEEWLTNYKDHKYRDSTIKRYIIALQKAEERLGISFQRPILEIRDIKEFKDSVRVIQADPNYEFVNKKYGNGDLSAALSAYKKYLIDMSSKNNEWWPLKEEYHPGFSKEKWIELLNDSNIFTESALNMIAEFYAFGGTATCAQLAEHYNRTYNYYLMTSVHLAERIVKATGCPVVEEERNAQNAKWWPVLYVGKDASKEEKGSFIWKIREELYEALTEFGIEKHIPEKELSKLGKFDSWEIVDDTTAIKTCDKSFFEHKGSGVPKGICWFFDAEDIPNGESSIIELIFNGNTYLGKVRNDITDTRRIQVFWNTDLANCLESFRAPNAIAIFKKLPGNKYEIIMSKEGENEMTIKEKVNAIKTYIAAKGFNYEGDLIENFYLSLKSKPFVILAGTSGTGKTRLVKLFAEAIGAEMKLVPVRPDWSDSSDLFGHTDLSNNFHPGAIIDFIKKAEWNKDKPFFLCLDEMNLARVEYYLSDFLSIIETRDRKENGDIESDALVDVDYYKNKEAQGKYGRVFIPENLYIIGTVNMDETTFPFSKKVLDRANTIEFSFVNLMSKPVTFEAIPQKLNEDNSFLKTEYLYLRDCDDGSVVDNVCFDLEELNQILVKANLHVGYRVRDEISFYIMNNKKADLLSKEAAFDHEIMQKILPRVQGSSAAIKDVLSELFVKCAGDFSGFSGVSTFEQMNSYIDQKDCKYPNSAKKIAFMMRRYEEDGFTSYWL